MKHIFTIALILTLSGCAAVPSPKVEWVSRTNIDEFTDKKTCSVTVGSLYTQNSVYTYSNHYYPYVDVVNGEARVGVKSGGRVKIPVGDVQIRIDTNKAWTISSSETPLDYVPEGTLRNMELYAKNLPVQNQELVKNTYKVTMESAARAMSPFTATTGDKAHSILREMLSGKTIKYRTIGLNQAASSTGEYPLGESLKIALKQCGVKL